MKKKGIRLFLALVLTVALILGTAIPTLAARPQTNTTVEITEISGVFPAGQIHYTLAWADDRGKATHFGVSVTRYPTALPENKDTFTEYVTLITNTPSPRNFILQHSHILPTYSYDIEVQLLVQKKNGTFRVLKGGYSIDSGKPFGYGDS